MIDLEECIILDNVTDDFDDKFLIFHSFFQKVAKSDWIKLNEFAEGAMIARNVAKASEIKHQRKKLLLK